MEEWLIYIALEQPKDETRYQIISIGDKIAYIRFERGELEDANPIDNEELVNSIFVS